MVKLEPGDYYTIHNDRIYCKDDIEALYGDNDTSSSANGVYIISIVLTCITYIQICALYSCHIKQYKSPRGVAFNWYKFLVANVLCSG